VFSGAQVPENGRARFDHRKIERPTWKERLMNKEDRKTFRIVAAFFIAMAQLWPLAARAADSTVSKTEVAIFQPQVPTGARKSGNCWTDSIAVTRPGAWRCMVGNEIYDPCFSSAPLSKAVICGTDPAKGDRGFVLQLTKRLPAPSSDWKQGPRPWLVKLADGNTCEIETGTIAFVAGIEVPYGCSDSKECDDNGCPYMTGLTERFQPGKVWTGDKVAFKSNDKGLSLLSRKQVPIAAVWK
jgi:hypothetical protein